MMAPRGLFPAFIAPGVVVLLLFFVLPLLSVVSESFFDRGAAYGRLFDDAVFWRGLRGSLVLGTVAPLGSVVVGFLVSLHLARIKAATRTSLLFLISLPLTFSGLIVAYGFILVFGRAGFVTLLLAELGADPAVIGGFIFTPVGLGVAYSYYLIPRVVMFVLPVIQNFDRAQIDAAVSLGAPGWKAHLDIMLPQILPSLVAAFCLTSAVAVGAYGTALALVGTQVNILPLVLYSKISETGVDFPAAAALSVVLRAITVSVIALAEILQAPRRRTARRRIVER
jgi:putative spermidine/putrescine transport system permease protein